jgi:hypothetical protein
MPKRKKTESNMQRLTFDIPSDVHMRLKLLAVESGKPMRVLILDWIKEHLSKPRPAK